MYLEWPCLTAFLLTWSSYLVSGHVLLYISGGLLFFSSNLFLYFGLWAGISILCGNIIKLQYIFKMVYLSLVSTLTYHHI